MFPLPLTEIVPVLMHFAPVFSGRGWAQAVVLVVGAILAPEKRTVTAALRVMGLADEKQFGKYHRVLSRAVWSSLALSRILLGLLVRLLLSVDSPLPIVIDETLERRQGAKIRAKGVFRDAVRSTKERVVLPVRTAAWYQKEEATFADAIAFVRRVIWSRLNCMRSTADPDWVLIPRLSAERLMDTLCYAA